VMLINRNPLVLVGRKTRAKHASRSGRPDETTDAESGHPRLWHDRTSRHQLVCAGSWRFARPNSISWCGTGRDGPIRRTNRSFFATPQSVVQQVATGALKAYGVTSREKLPEFPTADCFPITFGPKLDIVYWHAMFAPAGTPNSVLATLNKALQNAVSDPALVKIWAGEDVSVFPPDQRSLVAASALLHSEIARCGKVIRDNNIHIQQ
jgi:hypothetical protein